MPVRTYPRDSLEQAMIVAQKIIDENAGSPMKRLLVADAIGVSPSSSNFRYLLSSSRSYGLTEGTEKATDISVTALGRDVIRLKGASRTAVLRRAVMKPNLFDDFFNRFNGNKIPSAEMMKKILTSDFGVPADKASDAADLILENGKFAAIVRQISGSPHVLLDEQMTEPEAGDESEIEEPESQGEAEDDVAQGVDLNPQGAGLPASSGGASGQPKAIFIGHGRKAVPLEKLEKILTGFQIPYKVADAEPNLGRPIPKKVKDVMLQCGSAILIFTKDQRFTDESGSEVWRPSENVVHELGAASYAYEDRVVIFKEQGIKLPANFSSVGYIEFEENGIEAKTAELLQELIGFGLVKITPTG
jgi:predicted nucleotide-binding protein